MSIQPRFDSRFRNLFEVLSCQSKKYPDSIAIVCSQDQLSYSQLRQSAQRIADQLLIHQIRPGDRIGICMSKSCRAVATIYGILNTNASFVPFDPDHPIDRLQSMASDAKLRMILTDEPSKEIAQSLGCLCFNLDSPVDPFWESKPIAIPSVEGVESSLDEIPAYIIYTSGSTGTPKGVMVGHASVFQFIESMLAVPGFSQDDILLSASTLAFDITIYDLFVPIAAGGRIVLVDRKKGRDGRFLSQALDDHQATLLFATPTSWRILIESGWRGNRQRFRAFTGGEHLPRALIGPMLDRCKELWNFYGPTEATVLVTRQQIRSPEERILVGEPIEGTDLYIVDEQGRELPSEEEGELWIGGRSLAIGYWNRPKIDAERFLTFDGKRVYRTGDLCKKTKDGRIECLGRIDDQVKIRGHRIELGEIESVFSDHPSVQQVCVTSRIDGKGDPRIVAYIQATANTKKDSDEFGKYLLKRLPEYMIPSAIVFLDDLPLSPNGKIDRLKLPAPSTQRPYLNNEYQAPVSKLETSIASIWSEVLEMEPIGTTDNFFQLGGNSLLVVEMLQRVQKELGRELSATRFFDRPTISSMMEEMESRPTPNEKPDREPIERSQIRSRQQNRESLSIAVVGMAARFPGATDVGAFWKNLLEGVDSIRFFSPDELASNVSENDLQSTSYVAARGVLDGADRFDNRFFGIAPREAELIDPQQRILMELAFDCLEDAGSNRIRNSTRIGVWAGSFANTYFVNHILADSDLVERTGEFQLAALTEKDFIASRIAHHLDLKGPAVNVNTACSTSLVAIIEACKGLWAGDCDLALAGGATILCPQERGHLYQPGNILSADGRCRPFDREATGTLFSDGAGLVALKRLADAERDGDTIYAVVRGYGLNNDGGEKASFSAPSIVGQSLAIEMAQRTASIAPESIDYIEAHGTATPIGDPMEVAALTDVFRKSTEQKQFCGIGSVKSNIGHTVAAAGVAGFIKTVLSLVHEVIPATLHFENVNPALHLSESPFYVCDRKRNWPRNDSRIRRAGVSSFGVGGTNAHVLLEEYRPHPQSQSLPTKPDHSSQSSICLWRFSAKTEAGLDSYRDSLTNYANDQTSTSVADVAAKLDRRADFPHRGFAVVSSMQDAAEILQSKKRTRFGISKTIDNPSIIWMFPGQGSQYAGMGYQLYRNIPIFRESFDLCCDTLKNEVPFDLRTLLFSKDQSPEEMAKALQATRYTQPAIFALSYSLAQTWISWGVRPDKLIGHSIGEFVAACLSGVFTLQDSLKLIAKRGELLQSLPNGCMLAVQMSAEELISRLPVGCDVAAINAPKLCVVAGPRETIQHLAEELLKDAIGCRQLMTSHAFHSAMMDPAVVPFTEYVRHFDLQPPKIPICSTVTGTWLTDEEACDPGYWGMHLRSTVDFSKGIEKLLSEEQANLFLEVGPRSTLVTLGRQHLDRKQTPHRLIPSLSDSSEGQVELASILHAAGSLWSNGVEVDPPQFAPQQPSQHRASLPRLPGYPFQRKRFWLPAKKRSMKAPVDPVPMISPMKVTANPSDNDSYGMSPSAFDITHPPTTRPCEEYVMSNATDSKQLERNLAAVVREQLEATSGIDFEEFESGSSFMEMGINSLMMTQASVALQKRFGMEITFRQLLEETPTEESLVAWILERLSDDQKGEFLPNPKPIAASPNRADESAKPIESPSGSEAPPSPTSFDETKSSHETLHPSKFPAQVRITGGSGIGSLETIIQTQLQVMQSQLQLLSGAAVLPSESYVASGWTSNPVATESSASKELPQQVSSPVRSTPTEISDVLSSSRAPDRSPLTDGSSSSSTKQEAGEPKKVFGAQARVSLQSKEIDPAAKRNLERFIQSYNLQTKNSKAYAQKHRQYLADPRTVSGFQPAIKEMTYPIVVERSKGAYLWDIDGHRYIDLVCGFGSNFFGHSPDFMVHALSNQLARGYEIGPQSHLTGEVAELFCEMTGNERVAFCNTGSEAVLGAMRLARTVTGRDRFVMFTGDYHGILDEVIVRSNKKLISFPAAPGIPASAVQNVVVLEYGLEESLNYIEKEMPHLAAVIVESVQSRRPDFQPKAFLHRLRKLTENQPTALIFDEVITGFRVGPRGAQGFFDITADLATYGKVIGGGMPIGVIAGKKRYMDALDGGYWQFGDDSRPEIGMTYFAGTFVRHPLALAAAQQTLLYLKKEGKVAYDSLQKISDQFDRGLQGVIDELHVPLRIARFYSLIKLEWNEELPYGDLLFAAMRRRGIHIWEHRPCFLTLAHTSADIQQVVEAFRESVIEMQRLGFLPSPSAGHHRNPLVETARDSNPTEHQEVKPKLGKDRQGNPGWFIPDVNHPGQYLQVSPSN